MLLIRCPFCGSRGEGEFAYGGPAMPRRPDDTATMTDTAFVEYLTVPPNPMGPVAERWWHVRGCGRWLTVVRDTVSHAILEVRDGP